MPTPAADFDAATLLAHTAFADVRVLAETPSTQDHARQLVERNEWRTPGLVVAHRQTAGRGRKHKRWFADEGSIAVTFVLTPPAGQVDRPLELPLRAGLCVRRALSRWIDTDVIQIKWPNDVWADGRKIAGVLCERQSGVDLVGVGLNVAMNLDALDSTIARRSTSLHHHLRAGETMPTRQAVLIALAQEMKQLWAADDWCDTLNAVHALTGRDILIHTDDGLLAGVCEGVSADGRLRVRTGQTLHELVDGVIEK